RSRLRKERTGGNVIEPVVAVFVSTGKGRKIKAAAGGEGNINERYGGSVSIGHRTHHRSGWRQDNILLDRSGDIRDRELDCGAQSVGVVLGSNTCLTCRWTHQRIAAVRIARTAEERMQHLVAVGLGNEDAGEGHGGAVKVRHSTAYHSHG